MYVIYWEKQEGLPFKYTCGFVSYGNGMKYYDEYSPREFSQATKFKNKKDAQKLMAWYMQRGGFGDMRIMEVI